MKRSTKRSKRTSKVNGESKATDEASADTAPLNENKENGSVETVNVPKSPKKDSDDEGDYEVEQVVDMEVNQRRKFPIRFRVRWAGYGEADDSWIPLEDISCNTLVMDFLEVSGRKPEYEKAIEMAKKTDGSRSQRKRNATPYYSELVEDEEEILPSGTRTRKTKRRFGDESPSSPSKKIKSKKIKSPNFEEYEVQEIVAKREVKGNVEFKVRWRGYQSSANSWIPEKDLHCKHLVEQYNENIVKEEETEWKVENILKMRNKAGKTEYLVNWKGYNNTSDSWEPEENVLGCQQLTDFIKNNLKNDCTPDDNKSSPKAVGKRGRKGKSASRKI